MNSLLASGYQSLNFIRRELEELFDEFTVPRRMRHEVERAFVQAPSPMWLWHEMDHILEAFMSPPTLRRRVERLFDRVLSQRGFGVYNQNFGSPFSQFRGNEFGSPFHTSYWRGNDFNTFNTFNPFQSRGVFGHEDFTPPLELVETQGEYVVRVDLPGVRETDVETNITQDNVLIIRGVRRDFGTTRNAGFGHGWNTFARGIASNAEYSEQSYGVFTRTVPLPRNINPLQILAFFRDGVLEVRIAKFDSVNTFNSFNAFNSFNTLNGIRNRRVPIGRDESRVAFGSAFGNVN
jgi:HSP20 family protein